MKRRLVALPLLAGICVHAIAADSYSVDPMHTFPVFEVSHLGFSTQRGRFNKAAGKITLDLAGKSGSVELSIDAASIDMGFEKWDEHMRSDDFFNVAKFPTMTFTSNRLVFNGDKVVGADGEFTLHGVTKPLKIAVTNFRCGDHPRLKKLMCGADVSAIVKRSDFGLKYGIPAVGDEVKLNIPIEAYKD